MRGGGRGGGRERRGAKKRGRGVVEGMSRSYYNVGDVYHNASVIQQYLSFSLCVVLPFSQQCQEMRAAATEARFFSVPLSLRGSQISTLCMAE